LHPIEKIVIIGAGNVATNLGLALHNNGLKILQIVNRSLANAALLAEKVNATYTQAVEEIDVNADLYIIAVSDSSITEIAKKLHLQGKLIVHTAGSIDMVVLKAVSDRYGVFYPLQTFSKTELIAFDTIPVCIEANSTVNEALLIRLGKKLSKNVQKITSEQRKILHISAVYASNFSNYMYIIAQKMLAENKLSFDLLKPLILRTAEKVQTQLPDHVLTGPAKRNDTEVMKAHLLFLESHPEYQEIYKLISTNIVKHFHKI